MYREIVETVIQRKLLNIQALLLFYDLYVQNKDLLQVLTKQRLIQEFRKQSLITTSYKTKTYASTFKTKAYTRTYKTKSDCKSIKDTYILQVFTKQRLLTSTFKTKTSSCIYKSFYCRHDGDHTMPSIEYVVLNTAYNSSCEVTIQT